MSTQYTTKFTNAVHYYPGYFKSVTAIRCEGGQSSLGIATTEIKYARDFTFLHTTQYKYAFSIETLQENTNTLKTLHNTNIPTPANIYFEILVFSTAIVQLTAMQTQAIKLL